MVLPVLCCWEVITPFNKGVSAFWWGWILSNASAAQLWFWEALVNYKCLMGLWPYLRVFFSIWLHSCLILCVHSILLSVCFYSRSSILSATNPYVALLSSISYSRVLLPLLPLSLRLLLLSPGVIGLPSASSEFWWRADIFKRWCYTCEI